MSSDPSSMGDFSAMGFQNPMQMLFQQQMSRMMPGNMGMMQMNPVMMMGMGGMNPMSAMNAMGMPGMNMMGNMNMLGAMRMNMLGGNGAQWAGSNNQTSSAGSTTGRVGPQRTTNRGQHQFHPYTR